MPSPFVFAAGVTQTDDKPVRIHAILAFRAAVALAFGRSFTDHFRFGTSLELWLEFGFLNYRNHSNHSFRTFVDLDSLANFKIGNVNRMFRSKPCDVDIDRLRCKSRLTKDPDLAKRLS